MNEHQQKIIGLLHSKALSAKDASKTPAQGQDEWRRPWYDLTFTVSVCHSELARTCEVLLKNIGNADGAYRPKLQVKIFVPPNR